MTEQIHWKLFSWVMLLVVAAFGQGYPSASEPTYDVKVMVTDVTGAVIPTANVVFVRGSETVAAQTGTDGALHLRLPSGHYVVMVSLRGFNTNMVTDFAVDAYTPKVLKVLLEPGKMEQTIIGDSSLPLLPIQTSDLPNVLAERPIAGRARPKEGFVPDSTTAVVIAEAVLIPVYGREQIESERPLTAILKGDVWTVSGTLPCPDRKTDGASGANPKSKTLRVCDGGVAVVEISKVDAHIISMTHGK